MHVFQLHRKFKASKRIICDNNCYALLTLAYDESGIIRIIEDTSAVISRLLGHYTRMKSLKRALLYVINGNVRRNMLHVILNATI